VQTQTTAIYLDTSSGNSSVFLNDLDLLALEEAFVVGGAIWSLDASLTEMLLDDEILEGYLLPLPVPWWSAVENPGIQLANGIYNEFALGSAEQDLAYLLGLAGVDMVVEALYRSIIELDVNKINGDTVYAYLTQLEGYPVLGGLYSIDYSSGLRAPMEMELWHYQDGDWVPVGD
jgi:hypothetical protein